MNKPDKSTRQKLFESIRHMVATKHQVPDYLTEYQLAYILSVLTNKGQE